MQQSKIVTMCLLCVLTIGGLSQAADKPTPAGTWKWSVTLDDAKKTVVNYRAKLEFADDKLTGKVTLPNKNEVDIEDASFKDGEVAFTVVQAGGIGKATTKYKGKLEGDAIKGKTETTFSRRPKKETKDWEPTREKE